MSTYISKGRKQRRLATNPLRRIPAPGQGIHLNKKGLYVNGLYNVETIVSHYCEDEFVPRQDPRLITRVRGRDGLKIRGMTGSPSEGWSPPEGAL